MNFTYSSYDKLLDLITSNYQVTDYHMYKEIAFPCILRHDIDENPTQGLRIAEIEAANGVKATYFVLLNTEFYNVASSKVLRTINSIRLLGHEIGLHFDEMQYGDCIEDDKLKCHLYKEAEILSKLIGDSITTVSMHRPSKRTLENDYVLNGIVNSYSREFLSNFKYLSDSRMHWREDVEEVVRTKEYKSIHILTHPIWYTETGRTAHDILLSFINGAVHERYTYVKDNIRDLDEILKESDILR